MVDLVTVGWLTMDDIVLPDHVCHHDVLGGGALYSAVGARIWHDSVGIHSVTGRPFIAAVRRRIEERGLDAQGISAIEGNGLQLWLLHESEAVKQQVPKLTSSSADEMDNGRAPLPISYRSAQGYHIAPQSPAGSLANVALLSRLPGRPVVTMDILSDEFIDRRLYRDLSFLESLTAFLPSEAEILRIWNPPDLATWLSEQAARHGCHIVAKLGAEGSLVAEAGTGTRHHVPAASAAVVDTTGAGDAYCGGFLAGLVAGVPPVVCAAMGTVAAAYVVEACGALETSRPSKAERDERLGSVLAGQRHRGDTLTQ